MILKYGFLAAFVVLSRFYWTEIDIEAFNGAYPGTQYPSALLFEPIVLLALLIPLAFKAQGLFSSFTRLHWPLALFLILSVLSIAWSVSPVTSLLQSISLAICVGYGLLISSFEPKRWISPIWNVMAIAIIASLALAVAGDQHVWMQGYHAGALRGLFHHKNSFGPFVSFFLLVTIFDWKNISTPRLLKVLFFVLGFAGVFFSRSSTAIIVLTSGAMLGAYSLLLEKLPKRWSWPLHTAALTVLVAAIVAAPSLYEIITSGFGKDITLSNRTVIWGIALPLGADTPLGSGYGTAGGQILQDMIKAQLYLPQGSSAQSGYLVALLDIGWLGPVLVLLWLGMAFATRLGNQSVAIALLGGYAVLSITEVNSAFTPNSILLIILCYSLARVARPKAYVPTKLTKEIRKPQWQRG